MLEEAETLYGAPCPCGSGRALTPQCVTKRGQCCRATLGEEGRAEGLDI